MKYAVISYLTLYSHFKELISGFRLHVESGFVYLENIFYCAGLQAFQEIQALLFSSVISIFIALACEYAKF
jgi:hypothetical protein